MMSGLTVGSVEKIAQGILPDKFNVQVLIDSLREYFV